MPTYHGAVAFGLIDAMDAITRRGRSSNYCKQEGTLRVLNGRHDPGNHRCVCSYTNNNLTVVYANIGLIIRNYLADGCF